jgi:hypothetical protein
MTRAEQQAKIRSDRKSRNMCIMCGNAPPVHNQVKCISCKYKDVVYRETHKAEKSISAAMRNIKLRDAAIIAYGGFKCACCCETTPEFLSLDHMNNDGAERRRELGQQGGLAFYKWLRDHRYPAGLQVLCMNCNFGKSRNGGTCPHKAAQTKLYAVQ